MTKVNTTIKSCLMGLVVFLSTMVSGQYYGMRFSGDVSLDQRSSLDLTPKHAFNIKGNLDLQFHIRFDTNLVAHYGYIFRLILGDHNIDLIHYIIPDNPNTFELILGDKTSEIAFNYPLTQQDLGWAKLRFVLDFTGEKIYCYLPDTVLADDFTGYSKKDGFRLMFGAHSFGKFTSTDVPDMFLRDVEVRFNEKLARRWPLNEIEGNTAHSEPGGHEGVAFNPGWVLRNHNTWRQNLSIRRAGVLLSAYDSRNDIAYFVTEDSIFMFNLQQRTINGFDHHSPAQIRINNKLIYDTISDRLILYSLDDNYLSAFDFEAGKWSTYNPGPETIYWQHNPYITPEGILLAFGGYGWYLYKNSIMAWNPGSGHFDSLSYKGELSPRYLAGAGYNPVDGGFYIIGGFGSESGKQSESPDYYYDIIRFSFEDSTFTNVFDFMGTDAGFCFANTVFIDSKNDMYALYFPKYQFNNKLQLVRIPLGNPDIFELGNAIDYKFQDIKSFADLYFSRRLKSLVAISSYASDDSTEVSLHTIAFPPQQYTFEANIPVKYISTLVYYMAGGILILTAFSVLFIRRRKKVTATIRDSISHVHSHQSRKKSIYLFGGFRVFDNEGKEITGKFTPLPKKLFLFILLHSLRDDKGVSTNLMNETFWIGKSLDSARNNRAVNIVKIKSLLENLESTSISKETGYWKFNFDPSSVQIDYFEYLQIIRTSSILTREDVNYLLTIVENNPFLLNTHEDWLDPFKSEVSNKIIDVFLAYIKNSEDDPEFLLHLTNCIFLVDPVSEEALKLRCRLLIKQGKHSLAKKAYLEFTKEFKLLYNEDYKLSFKEVIEEG
jgi:hypothetical protein